MSEFRFADAWWLLLLLPLCAMTWISHRRQRSTSVLYSSAQLVRDLPVTFAQRVKKTLPIMRFAGMCLILIAAARPQAGLREFRITTEGIAIVMCLDRSGSMEALDFIIEGERVDRLAVVKKVFRDFVAGTDELEGRPNDLIGLVTFSGFAETKAPLTLDHGVLLDILKTVEITQPVTDRRGRVLNEAWLEEDRATAIGDALALSVDRLKSSAAKSKVIILLSDGENTAGVIEPEAAAEAAKEYGVKVHSIGIGSTGRVPFPITDPLGRQRFTARPVRMDETTLRMIAEKTGGQYFNAQDTETLEMVYAEIDQLEKSTSEGALYSEYRELFQWFLFPGLVALLIEVVLRSTRFRTLP